ncbi:SusC/RagA family TonB-linked outer membrane protein [Mucilaginibacter terrae]|uniref:TonB-linked SusC/RagA family outer membrane protein n=1 Tax=Mucilaginibacter terrae TaxID=1955052 RepID=A0ABU3GU05_9SPHI|nr:SusC/RagA family TonB-linked outer membrane protein [Mucilaginibacter terrae]MDT3403260.1 TonB-linked SusC/RagA family outer membrane protein [Mucilaginibacter terrae]
MKKILQKFLWGLLFFIGTQAYAQTRTVTGAVTSKSDGQPLPGVSVVVQGTKTGTQTGPDGAYSIKVGTGQSLIFSFIGFDTQTLPANSDKINVIMAGAASALNEVVVTGYGSAQTKRDNTGSIATVGGKQFSEVPVQSFDQALGGRAAGVQITIPNGVLNSPPVFRIRGTNSVSLSSQPLIVVDGVPVFTGDNAASNASSNALSNINPEDIDKIEIAKDASATAIYGSRAANGVVFVTTKKGIKGKAIFTLDSYMGWSNVYRLPTMMDAFQYTDLKNEALRNVGSYNDSDPTRTFNYFRLTNGPDGQPINTRWLDYVYRTGETYATTMSVQGGSDVTNYYFSANYNKSTGIVNKNDYKRKGMLFNVDHKVSKIISVGGKISYSNEYNAAAQNTGSGGSSFATAGLGRIGLVNAPNVSPYNNDGTYNINAGVVGSMNNVIGQSTNTRNVSTVSYYNFLPILDLDRSSTEVNHVVANAYLQVKPLPWISLKTLYGIDYLNNDNDTFQNPLSGDGYAGPGVNGGAASGIYRKDKRWVWTNTADFNRTFAGKHNIGILLGNEQQGTLTRGYGISRTTLTDVAFDVVQAGFVNNNATTMNYGDNYLVSFFGRLTYDFDKKYFLSATLRSDEYSAFGSDKKRGYFPGFGLKWDISQESFWTAIKADKIFSSFQVKGSYGKVGNNNGLGNYASYGFYGTGLYNGAGTLTPSQTGNNLLGWEASKKTDVGLAFGVLGDRITAEIDYYKNSIDDLIFFPATAPSAGLPTSPAVNIGKMYNQGLEITLNADAVRTTDFTWSPSFNIAFNRNKLTELYNGLTSVTTANSLETVSINQVGTSLGDLWAVRTNGVDPATGRRIFLNGAGREVFFNFANPSASRYQYADGTNAPAIAAATDAVNYGNSSPKAIGGFNNTFRYKNIDLSFLFTFQAGFYVYYGTQAGLRDQRYWNNETTILTRWTTPGQITDVPRVVYGDNVSNGSSFPITSNIYKGDFIKLRNINLGYNLPKSIATKLGLTNIRIYGTAQNLFVLTDYPGPDPEVSTASGSSTTANSVQGVDRNQVGNARTFTTGIQVKF